MRRIAMAGKVGEKGRDQVRKRVDAGRALVDDQIGTMRKAADELMEIKPVKATLDLAVGTINNATNFVRKQLDLTRERAR